MTPRVHARGAEPKTGDVVCHIHGSFEMWPQRMPMDDPPLLFYARPEPLVNELRTVQYGPPVSVVLGGF